MAPQVIVRRPGVAVAVLAAVVGLAWLGGRAPAPSRLRAAPAPPVVRRDWPMLGGTPRRNTVNLIDRKIPATWCAEPGKHQNIKWVAKLGSRSYGGPVIAGGKVYVGTNNHGARNPRDTRKRRDGRTEPQDKGVLMCFKEATGQFLWQHVNDKLASGQVNDWPNEGVASTPAIDGDRAYYVSNRCEVVCLDANGLADGNQGVTDERYKEPTDADVLWRLDMMAELNVFPHNLAACSPLVVGELVFVVTGNGVDEGHINLPSPEAPSFLAVHKRTGKVVWRSNLPTQKLAAVRGVAAQQAAAGGLAQTGQCVMHGQWGHPAYADVGCPQVIFPGGDGWLYAFEPTTGKLIWKFDANPKDAKYELGGRGTRSDFVCAPVIHDGRLYIGTGQDPEHFDGVGHLWCLDLARAVLLGRANPGHDVSPRDVAFDPTAPANRRSAFVWHYGGPEKNPQQVGRDFVFGRTASSCVVHDGLVYAVELAGYLHCLDARTGRRYWAHDLKAGVWPGSPSWVDGKLHVGTEDGDMWVFAHGRVKNLLGVVEVGQPIRSTPVAANGVLYVMTESHLLAVAAVGP